MFLTEGDTLGYYYLSLSGIEDLDKMPSPKKEHKEAITKYKNKSIST